MHREFEKAIIGSDLGKIRNLRLTPVFDLTDDGATAIDTLTLADDEGDIQLVYNTDWKLKTINFAPSSLAVGPNRKIATRWARIKTQTPN